MQPLDNLLPIGGGGGPQGLVLDLRLQLSERDFELLPGGKKRLVLGVELVDLRERCGRGALARKASEQTADQLVLARLPAELQLAQDLVGLQLAELALHQVDGGGEFGELLTNGDELAFGWSIVLGQHVEPGDAETLVGIVGTRRLAEDRVEFRERNRTRGDGRFPLHVAQ